MKEMKKCQIFFSVDFIFLLCILLINLTFTTELVSTEEKSNPVSLLVSWLDDKNEFKAGDIATVKIKILEGQQNGVNLPSERDTNRFAFTVNGRKGNSSYISGVSASPEVDSTHWNITFIPIMVGRFPVIINDYRLGIFDATLHFSVTPGSLHPSVCFASWINLANEFAAGTQANAIVLPKDAFGNNITSANEGREAYNFSVTAFHENGSTVIMNVANKGWDEFGYIRFEFVPSTAGNLLLLIEGENQTLNGSPLPFKVQPGPLNVTHCLAKWKYETNALQIFSKLEMFIYQQDQFGNLVPSFHTFDARVVEKVTNLSIPVADLYFQEVSQGIQLLSFSVSEPGEFMLTIFDPERSENISAMPYDYTVFVGYCHGPNSVVNGSGLASSVAGQVSYFSVYLEDIYHNPSPVEAERLCVQIIRKTDSYHVRATILPTLIVDEHRDDAAGQNGSAPEVSIYLKNTTSSFNVIYTTEKSGVYEIWVFVGNIPLNGDLPYIKEVFPGEVDISLSNVVKFSTRVPKLVTNEVVVQLKDSFSNPVLSQQEKLNFEIGPVNNSSFMTWKFTDNNDGSYVGQYQVTALGNFDICISFERKNLSSCPFKIEVYEKEYFPEAYNDKISVWENESIAFDAFGTDYSFHNNASIVETSMPHHGSLLQYGRLLRYTPHRGYFGNDSFYYTISDRNENVAVGTVNISILTSPPQFVSLPTQLQAIEDVICPRIGGFPGFEIKYSDPTENISVTLSTQSGTLFLAPMPLQFLQPWGSEKGEEVKDLILVGNVEVINFALHFIQYLGNENFYGNDVITVSTMNKNGMQNAQVPVMVEPINDSPLIHIPEYIILDLKNTKDYLRIFNQEKDTFEFSIEDPDLLNFPDNKSQFVVTISMEVNDGSIATLLSVDLINGTEVKPKNSYHWQPLQNFVTISNHFVVRGKGVRFRATIKQSNDALQRLLYQGSEHGAVLSISVNDMGNYGCHLDCTEKISLPLFTEANVNLIKRRPMTSLVAHSLGTAIIIEFVAMLFFGLVLLFFVCRCAIALSNERSHRGSDVKLSREEDPNKPTLSETSTEKATYFTGRSSSFLLRRSNSNFRQRSQRLSQLGESSKNESLSPEFSREDHQQSP